MNETQSTNSPSDSDYTRSERRRRLDAKRQARASRSGGGWVIGVILISIGAFLMLQNFTSFTLNNWWALFILIPALGAFGNAWRVYQANDGHLSAPVRSSFFGGVILTMISATFLLGLRWDILGPALLILAGIGLWVNAVLSR